MRTPTIDELRQLEDLAAPTAEEEADDDEVGTLDEMVTLGWVYRVRLPKPGWVVQWDITDAGRLALRLAKAAR